MCWWWGLELFTLAWLAPCPVPAAGEAGGRLALGPCSAHSPEAFSLFLVFKIGYSAGNSLETWWQGKIRCLLLSVGQKLELGLDHFLKGHDAAAP